MSKHVKVQIKKIKKRVREGNLIYKVLDGAVRDDDHSVNIKVIVAYKRANDRAFDCVQGSAEKRRSENVVCALLE